MCGCEGVTVLVKLLCRHNEYKGRHRNEDVSGPSSTTIDNTGRLPLLTRELVPVDLHGLPVQVLNSMDRSSEVLILSI